MYIRTLVRVYSHAFTLELVYLLRCIFAIFEQTQTSSAYLERGHVIRAHRLTANRLHHQINASTTNTGRNQIDHGKKVTIMYLI